MPSIPDSESIVRSQSQEVGDDVPLAGVYRYGSPGEPITLWTGMARMVNRHGESPPCQVRIELAWHDGAHIRWTADYDRTDQYLERFWMPQGADDQRILLGVEGEESSVPVHVAGYGRGLLNRVDFGGTQRLTRVMAHWVNLPHMDRGKRLKQAKDGREWTGRIDLDFKNWQARIDARPDIDMIYRESKWQRASAITHVMELRRRDGASFTATEAEVVLDGLQWGMGYALGRRVAPVLPIGFDQDGSPSWTSWDPRNAEHPGRGVLAWWQHNRLDDLSQYLRALMEVWISSEENRKRWRYFLSYATTTNEGTYTELRTVLAVATLERLSWFREVELGGMSKRAWKHGEGRDTGSRIRRLLQECKAETQLDEHTPALNRYLGDKDGPDGIAEVRNRIVHFRHGKDLSIDAQVLAEAARLAARYLDLVILHHLGYTGEIRNRTVVGGVSSVTEPVPWVSN